MKRKDTFLIGIVVGIVVLVVVAFVVAMMRPEPTFQPETTPEGVAHNYLLALRQGDLARAYGYLDPELPGFPATLELFTRDISSYTSGLEMNQSSSSWEVLSSTVTNNQATVNVRQTYFSQGGLFGSGQYSSTFVMSLVRDAPEANWKLTGADRYWAWCWNETEGCN
ncbi:hypothetical protein EYB53_005420 [Candidatus Chloroploca sp. M-50]|uniref:DUF4829 domain-containing protein n=1 Tax=Candidatus Chloroploca mongolica TaxID=2528176 RepID=A0ABS4D6U8_9CHLR|nr:hypothetical protein [Candidatus Chloroploca mongolica]MBP1465140.1 hypothetical protein [Candidatus Chloroploca mongolica]